jgi:hypothetical protein
MLAVTALAFPIAAVPCSPIRNPAAVEIEGINKRNKVKNRFKKIMTDLKLLLITIINNINYI